MKITIIGWYGTETIGDRAILAGLVSFLNKSYDDFEINLGSLYPFFSERTINEDYSFYKEMTQKDIKISIFNSAKDKELSKAIAASDLIIMGGGPLMDLRTLFMVEFAFKKAKKLGKTTALLGCGVGPLFHKKYKKSVLQISLNSDIIILRDNKSKDNLQELFKEFHKDFDSDSIHTSFDPAVECALEYKKLYKRDEQEYIAVNLRAFPLEYIKENSSKNIDEKLKRFIKALAQKYPDKKIRLIPMHYFHAGGDDRVFLNSVALALNLENIEVQNSNLTLKETIEIFQNAYLNVGMRFHSIVLQTISSGKNYILDYTEPNKGKTIGFLKDIDNKSFFKDRYVSLQEDDITTDIIQNTNERFTFEESRVIERLNIYIKELNKISLDIS